MCGIAGLMSFGLEPVSESLLGRMANRIAHRGPDDSGMYFSRDGHVGLGSRRLSIQDLSPAGHMPMSNEDGRVWVVFNGEIYNFQSLRPELMRRGHRFRSRTDTEVLLHLYEEMGIGFLDELEGMFAIAIWDENKRTLLLARDRLGEKPLYFAEVGGIFRFASEVKSILEAPEVPRAQVKRMGLARGYDAPGVCVLLGARTQLRRLRKMGLNGHRIHRSVVARARLEEFGEYHSPCREWRWHG